MKLLKSVAIVLCLALSLGSTAFAGPLAAVGYVRDAISEALQSIDSGASAEDSVVLVSKALNLTKEINANDRTAAKVQKANQRLKKARKNLLGGNVDQAKENLYDADSRFDKIEGYL